MPHVQHNTAFHCIPFNDFPLQYGATQQKTVQLGTTYQSIVRYKTVQYNMGQFRTIRYITVQNIRMQDTTGQYIAVHCSSLWCNTSTYIVFCSLPYVFHSSPSWPTRASLSRRNPKGSLCHFPKAAQRWCRESHLPEYDITTEIRAIVGTRHQHNGGQPQMS